MKIEEIKTLKVDGSKMRPSMETIKKKFKQKKRSERMLVNKRCLLRA